MAKFEYKCRRCNTVTIDSGCDDRKAIYELAKTLVDYPPEEVNFSLLSAHSCKDGGRGVSDLIGYTIDNPPKSEDGDLKNSNQHMQAKMPDMSQVVSDVRNWIQKYETTCAVRETDIIKETYRTIARHFSCA